MKIFALSFILIIFLCYSLLSQPTYKLYDDDIEGKLPPLNVLIDSALAKDPYVRFRELQLVVNNSKLKSDKTQWARNFGFQTDIRNGTFDNFSTNTSEGQSPSIFATKSNQTNYGIGAYMKFPIFDILNRKNQITLAQTELKQASEMAEMQKNEVRQAVIKQYNQLLLSHRLLRIRFNYVETSRTNMQMAEKEFKNGIINITEFSRISEITARSESDFETARIEFRTAYLILEEIVGIKFNLTEKQ
ncbi:MAG TPA: hypothetical protein DHV48_10900 [Prolixibacteraceae bacterium]|nr:hypothetical protein [Prolixibacteraceae bacterium]